MFFTSICDRIYTDIVSMKYYCSYGYLAKDHLRNLFCFVIIIWILLVTEIH